MNKTVSYLSWGLLSAALISIGTVASPARADDVEDLANLLQRQFTPFVAEMKQQAVVYHWSYSNSTQQPYRYLQWRAGGYFQQSPDHPAMMWGVGFYAALDGALSRSYGNQLVQVRLNPGVIYLDFRKTNNFPDTILSPSNPLIKRVCQTEYLYNRYAFDANVECVRSLRLAIERLGVTFIAYDWSPMGPAVNIIRTDGIDPADVTYVQPSDLENVIRESQTPGLPQLSSALPNAEEYYQNTITPLLIRLQP